MDKIEKTLEIGFYIALAIITSSIFFLPLGDKPFLLVGTVGIVIGFTMIGGMWGYEFGLKYHSEKNWIWWLIRNIPSVFGEW